MKELHAIQANLRAPKDKKNTFGGYNYRSCEDILEAVKPLLKAENCSLVINDEVRLIGDRYYIQATATLRNSEGETVSATAFAREDESKKGMDAAQVTGAASSYARKYALNGLFAIDDTKDPDTDEHYKRTHLPIQPQRQARKVITQRTLDNEGQLKRMFEILDKGWEANPDNFDPVKYLILQDYEFESGAERVVFDKWQEHNVLRR